MRTMVHAVFLSILLAAFCFSSACIFQPAPETPAPVPAETTMLPAINEGLTQLNVSAGFPTTLTYADGRLREEMRKYGDAVGKVHVFYVSGKDLDTSGRAATWVFGVGHSPDNEMISFDGSSWTPSKYSGTLSSAEITMDHIVSPQELFNRSGEEIAKRAPPGTPVRDLVLSDGAYTLTLRSGSDTRVLTFDATTGALIL